MRSIRERTTVAAARALALALAASCALSLASAAPAAAQGAPAANRDSIASTIRFLSIDPSSGEPRTRFVLREAPLRLVADSLVARLGRATGSDVERMSFSFERTYNYEDSAYTAENLAALLAGTGAIDGAVLVTAHYDAIASREPGWIAAWKSSPAPGANDNGSGVAAALEIARLLGGGPALPFDVLFVLFSAEELDRTGSADFVPRLPEAYGDRVIAALNLDMIGYSSGARGATIVSNASSGWLVDLLLGLDGSAPSGLDLGVLNPGPANSDHQAFWAAGLPAVTFMEPLGDDGSVLYSYYHTLRDTLGRVDVEQAGRIADFTVDFLEHLAERPAEIGLYSSDLLLRRRGFPTALTMFVAGDTVAAWVRPRNAGSVDADGGVRLRVTLENARGTRVLFDGPAPAPRAIDASEIVVPLPLDPSMAGENVLRASLGVTGMANDPANDAASIRFAVEAPTSPVVAHAVQPNPVRSDPGAAALALDLAKSVDLRVDILTIEGELLGTARLGPRYGKPLAAGMNRVALSSIVPDPGRLASGIYLYRIDVLDGDAGESILGRFAVVR